MNRYIIYLAVCIVLIAAAVVLNYAPGDGPDSGSAWRAERHRGEGGALITSQRERTGALATGSAPEKGESSEASAAAAIARATAQVPSSSGAVNRGNAHGNTKPPSSPRPVSQADTQEFLFQPIAAMLQSYGYDSEQILAAPAMNNAVNAAAEEVRASYRAMNEEQAMGLHYEALRVARTRDAGVEHFGAKPDASLGRYEVLTASSGERVWVYENDIPAVFAVKDKMRKLPEDLRAKLLQIIGAPPRR